MNWKNAERQVAKLLGGVRRARVGYHESIEDVIHHRFAIEVKYGKQIPKWVVCDRPTIINRKWLCISSKQMGQAFGWTVHKKVKRTKFVDDGLKQAKKYDKTRQKIPLLAMKPVGFRGIIFVLGIEHMPYILWR